MDTATIVAITALIGAVSGALASLLPILWSRRKGKADTIKVIEEAASSLVVNLERQLTALRKEVDLLQSDNKRMERALERERTARRKAEENIVELSRRVMNLEHENETLKTANVELTKKLNSA